MTIDIEQARADTPGCAEVTHLNNAGAALPPRQVTDAVIGYLRLEERGGGYEAARARCDQLEHAYDALATLIGAGRDEIAIVENATRAWDMAFYAVDFRPGERILTTSSEYGSNVVAFMQMARRRGVSVEVVPDDEHGQVSVEALREMLDDRVRLVAINHVPTHNGLVNPAAEVGRLVRNTGALYLLDACQSVGQVQLDVATIGCDMLSVTGRKYLRAPRGTGFLYVARRVLDQLEPPLLDHHAASWSSLHGYTIRDGARRFETWERFYAGQLGLGVAADYAMTLGTPEIEARVSTLAGRLRDQLTGVPGVRVHDRGQQQCGIVTFTRAGHEPHEIVTAAGDRGINISYSPQESARFDMEPRGLSAVVRASVHYYNTEEELDRLCATVAGV